MASLPRAVEFTVLRAGIVLKDLGQKKLSAATIREIFDKAMKDIKLRYPMIAESDVPPKIMRAILFRTTIPLTEEIMNLIQDSLLTNSLDVITENTKVIPTTNIMSAYIYGNYAERPYMYMEILSSMSNELLDMFGESLYGYNRCWEIPMVTRTFTLP